MICEQRCGGLAVGAGDAYHFCVSISSCEFNFGQNGNPLCRYFLNYRGIRRNTGTFHHNISVEYPVFRMFPLLEIYIFLQKSIFVVRFDGAHIAEEHLHTFVFAEDRSANTAFSSS